MILNFRFISAISSSALREHIASNVGVVLVTPTFDNTPPSLQRTSTPYEDSVQVDCLFGFNTRVLKVLTLQPRRALYKNPEEPKIEGRCLGISGNRGLEGNTENNKRPGG